MGAVRVPDPLLVGHGEVGVAAVVARAPVDQPRLQRAQQHRHVDALDRREPLDVRIDQVGEAVQVDGASGRAKGGPGGECLGGRGHRHVGLALPAAGDLAERLLVDRRDVGERVLARDPLTADEVVGRDVDTGDLETRSSSGLLEGTRADVDDRDAAVDGNYRAVQVGGIVGEEPGDGPGDLLGELGRRNGTSTVAAV